MRTDHLHLFAWSCTFIFARLHVFVYVFTSICIHDEQVARTPPEITRIKPEATSQLY
jgi:hypothetical protein